MLRVLSAIIAIILLSGCVGPASYNDEPNSIQRANILNKNERSITVQYSSWGTQIAFRLANDHCTQYDKVAVFVGSSQQYGSDVIGSWRCE